MTWNEPSHLYRCVSNQLMILSCWGGASFYNPVVGSYFVLLIIDQDITIMRHCIRLRNNPEFWFDAVDDKLSTLFDVYNPATFSFILLFTQIKPTIKWSHIILQSSKIAILDCLGQDDYSQ
jgi:hypothetical protein